MNTIIILVQMSIVQMKEFSRWCAGESKVILYERVKFGWQGVNRIQNSEFRFILGRAT